MAAGEEVSGGGDSAGSGERLVVGVGAGLVDIRDDIEREKVRGVIRAADVSAEAEIEAVVVLNLAAVAVIALIAGGEQAASLHAHVVAELQLGWGSRKCQQKEGYDRRCECLHGEHQWSGVSGEWLVKFECLAATSCRSCRSGQI